jgi:hypothetical protein
MNLPMMRSGWKLMLRSSRLLIQAFPNRKVMVARWKQIVVCSKVIAKGFFEKVGKDKIEIF